MANYIKFFKSGNSKRPNSVNNDCESSASQGRFSGSVSEERNVKESYEQNLRNALLKLRDQEAIHARCKDQLDNVKESYEQNLRNALLKLREQESINARYKPQLDKMSRELAYYKDHYDECTGKKLAIEKKVLDLEREMRQLKQRIQSDAVKMKYYEEIDTKNWNEIEYLRKHVDNRDKVMDDIIGKNLKLTHAFDELQVKKANSTKDSSRHNLSSINNTATIEIADIMKENQKLKYELETLSKSQNRTRNSSIDQREDEYTLQNRRTTLMDLNREVQGLQDENKKLNEIIKMNAVTILSHEKEVGELKSINERFTGKIERRDSDIKENLEKINSLNKELRSLRGSLEHEQKRNASINEYISKIKELQQQNEQLQTVSDIHRNCVTNNNEDKKRLSEMSQFVSKIEQLKGELRTLEEKARDLQEANTGMKDTIESMMKEKQMFVEKKTSYRTRISKLEKELLSKKDEVKNYTNMWSERDTEAQILKEKLKEMTQSIEDSTREKDKLLKTISDYRKNIDDLQNELQETRIKDLKMENKTSHQVPIEMYRHSSLQSVPSNDSRHTFSSIDNDSNFSSLNIEQDNSNLRRKTEKMKALLEEKCRELSSVTEERNALLETFERDKKVINDLERKLAQANYNGEICDPTSIDNSNKFDSLYLENVQLQETIADLTEKSHKLLDSADSDKMMVASLEKELANILEEVSSYKYKSIKSHNEAQDLFERNKKLMCQVDDLTTEKQELIEASANYKKQFDIIEDNVAEYKAKAKALAKEAKEMHEENTNLKKNIEDTMSENLKYSEVNDNNRNRITDLEKELSRIQRKIEEDNTRLMNNDKEKKLLLDELARYKMDNETLEKKNKDFRRTLDRVQQYEDARGSNLFDSTNPFPSIRNNASFSQDYLEQEVSKLRLEVERMKESIESKDYELSNLQRENRDLKRYKDAMDMPVYDTSKSFSSIQNPSSSGQNFLERQVEKLRLEIENFKEVVASKDEEMTKKQNALNIMKEKLKAHNNQLDIGTLNALKQQNAVYIKQVNDYAAEIENQKTIYKELSNQAALLRNEKNNLQIEMENLKRLNFKRNTPVPGTQQDDPIDRLSENHILADLLEKVPDWWRVHMVHRI